jgi:hypothetical protein
MTARFEVNQVGVYQFSAEERELAYEIYILEAARSPKLTADLFAERTGKTLHYRTIMGWAKEDRWADRYMADMQYAFPEYRKETAANLVVAGLQASRQLVAHFNGQKVEKGEDKMLFGALDRAGFSPVGNNDRVAGVSPAEVRQSSLIEKLLTPEERAAIAAEAGTVEEPDETDHPIGPD